MDQLYLFGNESPSAPLADRLRPDTLDGYVGQEHLIGEGRVLRRMIESDNVPSMIFWGPPGVGKTTLARIIAKHTHSDYVELSAVTSGVKEIKDIMNRADTYVEQVRNFLKMIDRIDGLADIVNRRTAKLNLYFSRLVRQAVQEGRMKKCSPHEVADKLEIVLETYLFQMVYFPQNKAKIRAIATDIIRVNLI